MKNHKEKMFDYLLNNPELLKGNYLQIDMFPNLKQNEMPEDVELLDIPYLFDFVRSGYKPEIRMNRYLIFLVMEFSKVKSDLKIYSRKLKIQRLNAKD